MHTLRRGLNALALLFIVLAAIGLAMVMRQQPGSSSIPFTFVALFAALPAAFHCIAALWAWPRPNSSGRSRRQLWGIGISSITLFAWVVACSAFVELAIREPLRQFQWQHIALFLAVVVLPLSSALNVHYFGQGLLSSAAE